MNRCNPIFNHNVGCNGNQRFHLAIPLAEEKAHQCYLWSISMQNGHRQWVNETEGLVSLYLWQISLQFAISDWFGNPLRIKMDADKQTEFSSFSGGIFWICQRESIFNKCTTHQKSGYEIKNIYFSQIIMTNMSLLRQWPMGIWNKWTNKCLCSNTDMAAVILIETSVVGWSGCSQNLMCTNLMQKKLISNTRSVSDI